MNLRLFQGLKFQAAIYLKECQIRSDARSCLFKMPRKNIGTALGLSDREERRHHKALVEANMIRHIKGIWWEYLPCCSGNGDRLDLTNGGRNSDAVRGIKRVTLTRFVCGSNSPAHEHSSTTTTSSPIGEEAVVSSFNQGGDNRDLSSSQGSHPLPSDDRDSGTTLDQQDAAAEANDDHHGSTTLQHDAPRAGCNHDRLGSPPPRRPSRDNLSEEDKRIINALKSYGLDMAKKFLTDNGTETARRLAVMLTCENRRLREEENHFGEEVHQRIHRRLTILARRCYSHPEEINWQLEEYDVP